jgi:hypothetical protein
LLRTTWIPSADVEKTETVDIEGVELSMEALGSLADGAAVASALTPLVEQYRTWIERQRSGLAVLTATRRETAEELLRLAGVAAARIERGVAALAADPDALDTFRVANRAVAHALRKRLGIETPRWRAFQLLSIRASRIARRWTCCSSRPAAERPRPISASQHLRWYCAGSGIRVRADSRAPE